jgi:hypothetical protein
MVKFPLGTPPADHNESATSVLFQGLSRTGDAGVVVEAAINRAPDHGRMAVEQDRRGVRHPDLFISRHSHGVAH